MIIHAQEACNWTEYQLIDCGNFQKLEQFGAYTLIRPEPQAVWKPALSEKYWHDKHDIKYIAKTHHSGQWLKKENKTPGEWILKYKYLTLDLKLKLALGSFKHVGCFPEQASNWDFVVDTIPQFKIKTPRILNLFSYTGAASIVARKMGAEVWSIDSVKQVLNWSKENAKLSSISGIHWVQEDVLKYLKRCLRRKVKFNGIIMDPPSYGVGPNKERWKLEEDIQELIQLVKQIINYEEYFIILNCYAVGMSSLTVHNLLNGIDEQAKLETGELFISSSKGKNKLPLGIYGRLRKTYS